MEEIDLHIHTNRSILDLDDGYNTIFEVKGDNKRDDVIVQAKDSYANQLAVESVIKDMMLKSSECQRWRFNG